jgi:hypothetical protein
VNAAWSSDHRESTTSEQQKKARSDSRLEKNLHDMGDLLSSLHTQAFCGQLDPTSFDHSLKYDEWIRLPSGKKSDNSKRVIIPTPAEMYQTENCTMMDGKPRKVSGGSCDTTVTSSDSHDSCRKRSRQQISMAPKDNRPTSTEFSRRPGGFGSRTALMSTGFASLSLQSKEGRLVPKVPR